MPSAPLLTPVGVYDSLYYATYTVAQQGVAGMVTAGIRPASGNNVAATGIASQLGQTPAITSNYAGSNVSFFDLRQFYMGCVLNIAANSAEEVPSACTVLATGYTGSLNRGSQMFVFVPDNAVVANEQKYNFNPLIFNAVTNVTLQVVVATGGAAATAMVMDNVIYTTYSKSS